MKNTILTLALLASTLAIGQTAPTTGKKVLEVKNGVDVYSKWKQTEYSLRVKDAFSDAPYKYHMKKLPKKLLKYGFTNVQITALGVVETAPPEESKITPQTVLDMGGTVSQAVGRIGSMVYHEEFQVNFDSDQGSFKVRLNMTATKLKYIIKEN